MIATVCRPQRRENNVTNSSIAPRRADYFEVADFPVQMDVIKTVNDFRIVADLPGVSREDVNISIKEDLLTVKGEKKRPEDEKATIVRSERFFGSFSRVYRLPETIDKSGVSADYKNGQVIITLPVKPEAQPRQIDIEVK